VVPADPDRPRPDSSSPVPATPPGPGQPVERSGPRAGGGRRGPAERPAPYRPPPVRFETVRNGYDRAQVERQVADLGARLGAVDEQRIDAVRRLAAERRRTESLEDELRATRAALRAARPGSDGTEPGTGFGYRAERILRMADAEARDIRAAAAGEAAALLDRTRAEAEAHRHAVEQELIGRSAELDRDTAERNARLDAHAAALAAEVESARREVADLRETARREAAELRREAESALRLAAAGAEQEATRRREAAAAELDRLTALQDGMREELARLHGLITAALPAGSGPGADPAEEPVTAGRP
jgi:hypothetical protein